MGVLEPKGVSFVDREEAHRCRAQGLFLTCHTWFSEEQADFLIFVREFLRMCTWSGMTENDLFSGVWISKFISCTFPREWVVVLRFCFPETRVVVVNLKSCLRGQLPTSLWCLLKGAYRVDQLKWNHNIFKTILQPSHLLVLTKNPKYRSGPGFVQ